MTFHLRLEVAAALPTLAHNKHELQTANPASPEDELIRVLTAYPFTARHPTRTRSGPIRRLG